MPLQLASYFFFLIVVILLGQTESKLFHHFRSDVGKQVKHLETDVNSVILHRSSSSADDDGGCSCVQYNCGCCAHLFVPEVHLDHTGCVNVSYLPHDYGVRLTLSLDKYVLINMTMSARNPPPLCVGIPHLKDEASVCVEFYNLDVSNKTFSGCIKIEVRLLHIMVKDIKIGCFHMPIDEEKEARLMSMLLSNSRLSSPSANKRFIKL